MERIDDPHDPRVADYLGVADPELMHGRGVFVAEGRLVVQRLLEQTNFRVRSVFLSDSAHEALSGTLASHPSLPVFVTTLKVMREVTGFDIHRGALALGERPVSSPLPEIGEGRALFVVLEGVGNADNVGGIFRNAAAFGADAVLIGPGCCDPLYRKAIRVSMGASLSVPFAPLHEWPGDLERLRARGFTIAALTTDPAARDIADVERAGIPQRLVLMVGAEDSGLTAEARARADLLVRIPMRAHVDSLNAATATAIALHRMSKRFIT